MWSRLKLMILSHGSPPGTGMFMVLCPFYSVVCSPLRKNEPPDQNESAIATDQIGPGTGDPEFPPRTALLTSPNGNQVHQPGELCATASRCRQRKWHEVLHSPWHN